MEEAAKQRIKSAAGHLKWMPRRFAPHRILLIEMINPSSLIQLSSKMYLAVSCGKFYGNL